MAGCFEEYSKISGTIKCVKFLHQLRSLVHGENRLKTTWYLPIQAEKLHILSYNIRVFMFWNILTQNCDFSHYFTEQHCLYFWTENMLCLRQKLIVVFNSNERQNSKGFWL